MDKLQHVFKVGRAVVSVKTNQARPGALFLKIKVVTLVPGHTRTKNQRGEAQTGYVSAYHRTLYEGRLIVMPSALERASLTRIATDHLDIHYPKWRRDHDRHSRAA
jgi:hypothetical protein